MSVVDLPKTRSAKRRIRTPRDLVDIGKTSAAGRFFDKMTRDISSDLGGRRELTRIETELVGAFAGAATTVRYLSRQVCLGDISELDLSAYATLASVMLRIGSRLGLSRRQCDVTDMTLDDYLHERAATVDDAAEDVAVDDVQP
jgi:hypothetical protein